MTVKFVPSSKEESFRRMERFISFRDRGKERVRLIKQGVIRPLYRLQPQMLIKDSNGRWCPEIKIRSNV